jgi:hypothetical protein
MRWEVDNLPQVRGFWERLSRRAESIVPFAIVDKAKDTAIA